MAQVQSLAQEIPHAMGVAKKKKNIIKCSEGISIYFLKKIEKFLKERETVKNIQMEFLEIANTITTIKNLKDGFYSSLDKVEDLISKFF